MDTNVAPFEQLTELKARSNPQARGWLITAPAEHYTQEYILKVLGEKKVEYVFQLERGKDTGYLHNQIYIESPSPIRFSTLKKLFPKGHIEVRRGTVKQAYDYCSKSETRVGETIASGKMQVFYDQAMKLRDYIELITEQGMSVSEIIAEHPTAVIHARELEKLEAYRRREVAMAGERELSVHYLWGQTGTGKTKSVYDRHGYAEVYRVSDYEHPFDNYDGQSVLVLDEFRGQLTLSFMLNLLDPYPLQLPARYQNKWASFTTVYVLSNIPLSGQYHNVQVNEPESFDAFCCRFDTVDELTGINHREARRQKDNPPMFPAELDFEPITLL